MPRPKKCRRIEGFPDVTYFKPRGIPLRDLKEADLPMEGFEALRLSDFIGLTQEEAAARMKISRQTFGRILTNARNIVARALVDGMALRIQGGEYIVATPCQTKNTGAPPPCRRFNHLESNTAKDHYIRENHMNKIAISSEGPTLDDQLDPRFGRAAGFIIADPNTLGFEYIDNGVSQTMAQGAGVKAAEIVAAAGVEAVLTGFVGPKAFMALEAAGVKIAHNLDNMTVRDAIERFRNNNVDWASAPNRQGHGR